LEKCRRLEKALRERGVRVVVDTRERTPGWKFNDWELRGVPIRAEIGRREVEEGFVTLFRRDLRRREKVPDDAVVSRVFELAEEILEELKRRARAFFESRIARAKSRDEVEKALARGMMVKMAFCGREECAADMQEATNGGKVRGVALNEIESPEGKVCAWCGRPAKQIVYVARAY